MNKLRIREHGDPFCYLVESTRNPTEPYFVDLTQRQGHGACNCIHYSTTANPNHKAHGQFVPYSLNTKGKVIEGVSECKHIARAREHYHINVTMPILAQYNGEQ